MDQDIISMFKEKNKSILIQNLKFDTERNVDSLISTLNNIIVNDFEIAKRNIKLIFDDYGKNQFEFKIDELLSNIQNKSYNVVEELINLKRNSILNDLESLSFEEEEMNNYYALIDNTTKVLQEKLCDNLFDDIKIYANKELSKFINKKDDADNVMQNRIVDYINIRLFKKLEDKILSSIRIRDNNLINKGKESYDKYQEINKKTTQVWLIIKNVIFNVRLMKITFFLYKNIINAKNIK